MNFTYCIILRLDLGLQTEFIEVVTDDFNIHIFVKTGNFRHLYISVSFQRIIVKLRIFSKFGMMN